MQDAAFTFEFTKSTLTLRCIRVRHKVEYLKDCTTASLPNVLVTTTETAKQKKKTTTEHESNVDVAFRASCNAVAKALHVFDMILCGG